MNEAVAVRLGNATRRLLHRDRFTRRLATLSGEWAAVEEVYDTGEWEPVYNLRVADHHTYFVGDETWGFALWAHNSYRLLADVLQAALDVGPADDETLLRVARSVPQAASAKDLNLTQFDNLPLLRPDLSRIVSYFTFIRNLSQ